MPISALPNDTSQRIGSTLNITSAVLVLKEVLDNALDSGAQAVHVTVSSNTVDKIEVKDNGSGISSIDFDALGRPSHTSKLSSFEGLDKIGGKSLGFRGTALASINSLATVHVVTRTGNETPQMIRLADGGGVALKSVHAAEQGTTVTVTNIFSNYPVRARIAKKPAEISKNIERMRQLVQAYAFARHPLRIHFTILQHPQQCLKISPRPDKNIMETAAQIFGVQKASQCFVQNWPDGTDPGTYLKKDSIRRHVFEAILMKPNAEHGKLPKGLFFSVDSRPISATRGIGRKLATVLRECLRRSNCPLSLEGVPKDVFICLNIRCTPGGYDVNIEPSKEDVLFMQEDQLIADYETFLETEQGEGDSEGVEKLQAQYRTGRSDGQEEDWPEGPESSSIAHTHRQHMTPQIRPSQLQHDRERDDANVCISDDHGDYEPSGASSWTVDMSAPVDDSDEDNVEGSQNEITPTAYSLPRDERDAEIRSPEQDDQLLEPQTAIVHDAMAGLNPWSIAAMGSLNRRPPSSGPLRNQQFHDQEPTPSNTPPGAEAMRVSNRGQPRQRELRAVRPNPRFKLPVLRLTPSPSLEKERVDLLSLGRNRYTLGSSTQRGPHAPRRADPCGPEELTTVVRSSRNHIARELGISLDEIPMPSRTISDAMSRIPSGPKRQTRQHDDRASRRDSNANIVADVNDHLDQDTDNFSATTDFDSSENTDSDDQSDVGGAATITRTQQHSNRDIINRNREEWPPIGKRFNRKLTQATLPFASNTRNTESHTGGVTGPVTTGLIARSQYNPRTTAAEALTPEFSLNPNRQMNEEDLGGVPSLQRFVASRSGQRERHVKDSEGEGEQVARFNRRHLGASNHDNSGDPQKRAAVGRNLNTRSQLPLEIPGYERHAPRLIINTLESTFIWSLWGQKFTARNAENGPASVPQHLRGPCSQWDTAGLAQLKKLLRRLAPTTEWTLHPKNPQERNDMRDLGRQWVKEMGLELQS
ncbi:hypothetical protein QBC40DRAFT_333429 [Triangularia verruculosa]|uniref:DNA mismatch repair protein S5 domain-containing protein n=1 Tax=Triangularia verruculosa TaxID=2587418 RepID=A0AAN6XDE8_9PEZI|nr:hypothetical protein QBC40DRAFT_333429 [Triangularia verruculosa]